MNLNMSRPKNETEDSLLSITKNCETSIKPHETTQNNPHTKPQETLEFQVLWNKEKHSISIHL